MYDGVLRLETPVGARLIAYADDLAVVVVGRTEADLAEVADKTLESQWMEATGLRIAAHKTEAILLTRKRRSGRVFFHMNGEEIPPKETVKYLRIRLDRARTFIPHVEETTAKAERMAALLGRIMPNVKGARSSRRKLLAAVIHSRLLYGSAAWIDALRVRKNVEAMTRAQRRILLRVA
jgi:hypothetical protein